MKFLSVCSGIEAASVAWTPLGWKAVAFSEIEPFPSAVLAHHYPGTPNWGDMTKFKEWPDVPIDLLCGGTPCQSFSVAGLRKGLDDPRGNLMLTFGAIAAKYRPKWLAWENVPGVLSSNGGADFGSFLGMLGELGYGFAYRVLDAQYFGVAQRRRRVFVVGCLGDWRSAAAVLFERHSLSGNPAPSRQARQATTRGVEFGPSGGRFTDVNPTLDTRAKDGPIRNQLAGCVAVAGTMKACKDSGGWSNSADHAAAGHMIPVATLCVATAQAHVPAIAFGSADFAGFKEVSVSDPMRAKGGDTGSGSEVLIAFPARMSRTQCASAENLALSMGATNPTAIAFQERGRAGRPNLEIGGDLAFALTAPSGGGSAQERNVAVPAYSTKLHNTTSNQAGKVYEEYTVGLDRKSPPPALLTAMQVRRLTPTECERLMGFPDGYTQVPMRGKPAADGPRYKSLGNSWAIPNVRWIGERIDAVEQISRQRSAINGAALKVAA